ncbi:NADP-specific glutamate dehydrogenase [Roseicitreum antarcticum]|uniref:Glutamate dehydrogenase n=1 Tax=Roseicitreum antarcticum TaxID=564137 RepID=A0A1H2YT28_9RHOB|nr:NADP-specific glutamate dehydrogenase [Roseicitreum antarcticum]SDX08330.1 glutamate dehydrogenase (NADP+) [Roseicitreum antarcticum]
MKDRTETLVDTFMSGFADRHAHEPEFLQAVQEVAQDVLTIEKANSEYAQARVLERLAEADRIIGFRVTWRDDAGAVQINKGWRVQQTNLLGPYKGGLRWAASVTPSVLKFLAFEQAFKNALTGLPLGAAKGGADFDPRGRSDAEVERFAMAFMAELAAHIGPERDVPAGDIGVGAREVGYLTRAWMQHARRWGGALTGKPLSLGGSPMRAQATGYGLMYFTQAMLAEQSDGIEGKRVAISGRGNVAQHAARKAMQMGAKVITLSGRAGTWVAEDGMRTEAVDWVLDAPGDGSATPPAALGLRFLAGQRPWGQGPDIALPCATQNEVGLADARALVDSGCRYLAEGANMPLSADAEAHLAGAGVIQAPGKASNAGGVAMSGLEMQQNAGFARWSPEELDRQLCAIMCDIHARLKAERTNCPTPSGAVDYRRAANVAGYRTLARAMVAGGVI